MESDGKQVEEDADGTDSVHLRTELTLEGCECFGAEDRVGQQPANLSPKEANEHGSDQVRQQQPDETDSTQGSCTTRVPGEKTKKSVKQKHGHRDGSCLPPKEASASHQYVDGRGNERDPSQQIQAQASAREHWVHGTSLVFDFQTAKNDGASDHQRLERVRGVIRADGPGFVLDPAENGRAAKGDLPPHGDAKFHAAENGGNIPALKVLADHAAFQTSEDDGLIQRRAGVAPCRYRLRRFSAPAERSPQHQNAESDQHQRPKISPAKMRDSQLIQLEQDTRSHQESAPVPVARNKVANSDQHDEQGPEAPPKGIHGNVSHVIEEEGEPDEDQNGAHEDAAASTPAKV